jgi:hypothetical protein
MNESQPLFRPVGVKEMELILLAEAKAFPPRLPEQPIFYPVLTFEYAEQIAQQWNTKDERSGYAGFVTHFEVERAYLAQYEEHQVGASIHRELWIPVEELDEFNQHILGHIKIVAAFYGEKFQGAKYWRANKNATEQFLILTSVRL